MQQRQGPTTLAIALLTLAVAGMAALGAGRAGPARRLGPARPAELVASTVALAATPAEQAQVVYDRMTQAQRIGQLFMVGTPVSGLAAATSTAVSTYHVGNVVLTGRTTSGAAPVRALTARLDALTTSAATSRVPMLISTDQEGGLVQVLKGPWFSTIPSAQTQGTWSDTTLRSRAATWGRQVFRAGVNVDLAPVMDVVPRSLATTNFIATARRNYGWSEPVVAEKGAAFTQGMKASGLAMTAKHFPGLGHVTANTDTTASVVDTVTTPTSTDLRTFPSAVSAGAPFVMVSSATYSRIDAGHPAAFSKTVITTVLRHDLGFGGVVMSDDLGNAKAVQRWSPGTRAVSFLAAGGDIVLTVNPTTLPAMVNGVAARASSDAGFRATVKAAVLRVLTVKATYGLLATRPPTDGRLGASTVRAVQRWLGRTQSGILDRGTVIALQTRVGTTPDGAWGPNSMASLQTYLGISHDGARGWNARTVAQLQRYLATQL
jgi:beta-N-acetylhexosaminidase